MFVGALLACAAAAPGPPLLSEWFVDPLTIKITSNRRKAFPGSAKVVDLAAQRGECERAQLWGWNEAIDLANVKVAFGDLHSGPDTLYSHAWEYMQQLYVFANSTDYYQCNYDILSDTWNSTTMSDDGAPWSEGHFTNYHYHRWPDCAAGWYPDPLMPLDAMGIPSIPKGFTQPIFLEVCVPPETPPGNYSGSLTVSGEYNSQGGSGASITVPIELEVWDIVIPTVADPASFTTIFNWGGPGWMFHLEDWYSQVRAPYDATRLAPSTMTLSTMVLSTYLVRWFDTHTRAYARTRTHRLPGHAVAAMPKWV